MNNILYEDSICKFYFKKDILHVVYKPEVINLEVAKLVTAKRHQLLPDIPIFLISNYSAVKNTTREARQYFTSPHASHNLKAVVLLINSPVGRIMGNFFTSLNKPPYAFKIFNEMNKAEEWIEKYVTPDFKKNNEI